MTSHTVQWKLYGKSNKKMASESIELHTSLVKWVRFWALSSLLNLSVSFIPFQLENCLALGGTLSFDESTVNDGTAIADCLVQLSPDVFTLDWRSKIITETAGNWKLRVCTYSHIVQATHVTLTPQLSLSHMYNWHKPNYNHFCNFLWYDHFCWGYYVGLLLFLFL